MKKFLMMCLVSLGLFVMNIPETNAQRIALKTNALDWVMLSPNLALEVRLERRLTLDLSATANPITREISGMKLTHFRFQPEFRYWFSRPMAHHFLGFNLMAGFYNVKFGGNYYDGDICALGMSYGYVVVLSRHWNMEATLGLGYGHLRARQYADADACPEMPNFRRWAPMSTRVGLSFSYIFK